MLHSPSSLGSRKIGVKLFVLLKLEIISQLFWFKISPPPPLRLRHCRWLHEGMKISRNSIKIEQLAMASFGGRWAGPCGGQHASNRLNIVIKMTVFAKKMKYNHSKLAKKVKVWGVSCEFSLKKSNKNSRLRRNIPFALAVGALAPQAKSEMTPLTIGRILFQTGSNLMSNC